MTGKDMHILFVMEDAEAAASIVRPVVTQLDADITMVDSVADARACAASGRFDVIIAHQSLRDGSALELLRPVCAIKTPVIFIEDELEAERVLEAMRRGAADVIRQPIDQDDFIKTIRRVVRNGRVREREQLRAQRLRRLSSKLIKDRRELRKRVDLICRDLVVGYRRMAEKVVNAGHLERTEPTRLGRD